jgi:heparosan-N-sulfate-glucuronate 5-epimerase
MSDRPAPARNRAGFFSSARTFSLPIGERIDPAGLSGYYIDMRIKAETPAWPPEWFTQQARRLHVDVTQWGLGALERYLAGEGEEWLAAAANVADHLMAEQEVDGPQRGGWVHRFRYPHSLPLPAGWLSAMAQGEAASFLTRLHLHRPDDRLLECVSAAMRPMQIAVRDGGVQAVLDGSPIPEEYPTDPPSFVLNGAIFALWGIRDAGHALGDSSLFGEFEAGVGTLARNIHRWDTGYWSRYDLFPHPVLNPASSFYHALHVSQLEAMLLLSPQPQLAAARDRFETYAASPSAARRAFARKALFRLAVPRNGLLAHRLPWTRRLAR